jgi:hypothetical protein
MNYARLAIPLIIIFLLSLGACSSKKEEQIDNTIQIKVEKEIILLEEEPIYPKYTSIHSYGGWYCPDNLLGFPAINILDLKTVPIVLDRLPTKKETREGSSLMFFDTNLIHTARPLELDLPRVARYYSEYTKKNELVIVIQAVIAEEDTVVGFRYLNGGNGSAWLGEVFFVSEEEIKKMGSTPFVSIKEEIKAPKEKVWEVITSPTFAKTLGAIFDKGSYVKSDWKKGSKVYFIYEPNKIVSTGIITASWENMYVQVDYNFEGYHYVEKFLLVENKENKSINFYLTTGPYGDDYNTQIDVWSNWLKKVKEISEVDLFRVQY